MKFKESPLVKNHKILTGTKRDMRKKVVKSTTPTSDLKKPTTLKRQLGGNIFTTYNSIAPYEGPVFEQPVATVEIKELPISRLETNRQNVMAKAEEKKEEPVVEEKVNTEPLPTSKEETPVVENKESAPINIKSKDEFIKTMTPAFENALKARGLDTKYAKYLVAQSALESNWGKSQSGKFNFGGIKGKGTIRKTREVINGKSIHVNDSFRDFKDINDYANYHVSLLNNKRYQAFSGGDFIDRVVKGGYATDPNYKRALSNVYNQIAKAQEGMKIPKLKGVGELKARILRQFNREKAANRNEEQLIGFDWSRYKSNKPKPETTPTQSEQLENGGIIKYQNPSSGIKYMGGYDKRGNMVLPVTNENGMNNVTLPEVTVTPRNINLAGAVDRGRRVAGNIGKEILSATTPLGDIESAKDIYQDTTSGNYGQAALGAGLLLLPNFIEKPLKTLKRVGKDYITITKDVVSSPKKFIQARKSGTYPLTYAERRAYLEKAHNIGDLASNRVKNLNREDFNFRKKRDPNGFHEFIPVEGVNTKYTFNSKSWENFDSSYNSLGTNSRFDNINSHIRIKESPDSKYLIPTNGVNGIGANVAHELQHSYQRVLPDIKNMGGNKVSNGLVDVNPYHEASPILTPLKENSGKWVGDPLELNSEIMSLRAGLNASRYNLMTPKQQKIVNDIISQKFQLNPDITHNMLNELGKLGYRNGGKL